MTEETEEQTSSATDRADQPDLRVTIAVRSDVGRVRSENQDYAITSSEAESSTRHGHLMVVADGMGGHKGGATASRLAATGIKESYFASEGDDVAAALRDAIEQANSTIFEQAHDNEDLEGMGTTTSAMVIRGRRAWIGHVGDSRIYRVRGGEIEQMTEDHSLVATMVKEGLLTAEEAEVHPRRNVLQRSMGVGAEVDVDIYGPFELEVGDRFILCSDGLHGLVNSNEMAEIAGKGDIETAADRFIGLALERGAHDNVTVIVAAADEPGDEGAEEPASPEVNENDETVEIPVTKAPKESPSMGKSGCLLRTLLIGLSLLAVIGSFFLLVAGDLFVSWFRG